VEGAAEVEVVSELNEDGYEYIYERMSWNCGQVSHIPSMVISATMLSPKEHCFTDEIIAAFR
jgi:hypothetical protein